MFNELVRWLGLTIVIPFSPETSGDEFKTHRISTGKSPLLAMTTAAYQFYSGANNTNPIPHIDVKNAIQAAFGNGNLPWTTGYATVERVTWILRLLCVYEQVFDPRDNVHGFPNAVYLGMKNRIAGIRQSLYKAMGRLNAQFENQQAVQDAAQQQQQA